MKPMDVMRQKVAQEAEDQLQIRASLFSGPPPYGRSFERPLPYNKHFLFIHFETYSTDNRPPPAGLGAFPAEFCIAAFSIRDGLEQCYSRLIDPGKVDHDP